MVQILTPDVSTCYFFNQKLNEIPSKNSKSSEKISNPGIEPETSHTPVHCS
jgi:hypothetical protein